MILRILLFNLLILTSFTSYSQIIDSLNFGPEPINGINKLALEYYKIDFDKQQRAKLEGVELEFIFNVDTLGQGTLEKIHGLDDSTMIGIMQNTTKNAVKFYPRTVNGEKEASIYFMKLRFPTYQALQNQLGYLRIYKTPKYNMEDFEQINLSGKSVGVLLGGVTNGFLGNVSNYLNIGGGMRMEVMLTAKKGFGGSLMMSFYGNKLKKDFPINSTRAQNSAPPTLFVGVGLTKSVKAQKRNELILQLELNMAVQNITPKLGDMDKEWTQFKGFSPAFVAHYLVQIGKSQFTHYAEPVVTNQYINFHGAIRPLFFGVKEANGVMLELGLSYRLVGKYVEDYKLNMKK
jgi:hypothetical protein